MPINAPIGASIYTQALLMNPWAFPSDPIKLSQAIEWQVGGTTKSCGNASGMSLWPTGTILVQPGTIITMSFSIL